MLLVTDGVTEARKSHRCIFRSTKHADLLSNRASSPEQVVAEILDAVRSHQQGQQASGHITILVLEPGCVPESKLSARAKVETAEEDTSRHMGLVRQEAPIVLSDPLQRIPAGKMDAFGADQRNIVDAEGLLFGGIFFCRRF